MQFVSEDERLVGVMCLHNDLNHALKGVTPQHSKLDGTRGRRLVVDAKVRYSDRYDVGLRCNDVLRVNRPHTGVREVEGTLDLALIDPLEVTNDV